MPPPFSEVIKHIDCYKKKYTPLMLKGFKYLIYGAGDTGKKIARQLVAAGYDVAFLFDDHTKNQHLMPENIPIYHSSEIQDARIRERFMIIIATWMTIDAVEKKLAYFPDFDVMTLTELFVNFSDLVRFDDILFLTSFKQYWKQVASIQQLAEIWADDISINLYHQIWLYRLTGNRDYYPVISSEIQYFPKELLDGRLHEMNLLDCGAHIGDTIKQAAILFKLSNVIAFEPDLDNFKRLSAQCTLLKDQAVIHGVLFTLPCGVYDKTQYLRFSSSGNQASHVSSEGETIIQTVRVDDLHLESCNINFIKMDIEGAEVEALQGMQMLIQKQRPILALSAYHKPNDLLNIVLLLKAWDLNYQFYLRNYRAEGMDLIIYALPVS